MADEVDSKSIVGDHVWVQVPLPAVFSDLRRADLLFLPIFTLPFLVRNEGRFY